MTQVVVCACHVVKVVAPRFPEVHEHALMVVLFWDDIVNPCTTTSLVQKRTFIPGMWWEYEGLCLFVVTSTNLNTSCLLIQKHSDHIRKGFSHAYLLCRQRRLFYYRLHSVGCDGCWLIGGGHLLFLHHLKSFNQQLHNFLNISKSNNTDQSSFLHHKVSSQLLQQFQEAQLQKPGNGSGISE